ncbi:MAG: hypothetical protein EOP49_10795 [Sphingobacteriales bacterium]|nr:MAG: hypothetical protein EOP49_10795 [Sphingobacteriales bacterium]
MAITHRRTPALMFTSKIGEFKANLDRKNTEAAMSAYMDLASMMHKTMSANNEKLNSAASEAEKTKLKNLISQQEGLYRDAKMLTPDLAKNNAAIVEKLNAFVKTL